jgi:hypothetical protein
LVSEVSTLRVERGDPYKWNRGSFGNPGSWISTFGRDGKFHKTSPPPLPFGPQPGHPTMTGRRVGCPSEPVVLNHVFEVQSDLDVYSIEKPGGGVVKVLVTATVVRFTDEGGILARQVGQGEHGKVGFGPGPLKVGRPTLVVDPLESGTEKLLVCPGIDEIWKLVAVLPWLGTMTETLTVWPETETGEGLVPLPWLGTPEEEPPESPAELGAAVEGLELLP